MAKITMIGAGSTVFAKNVLGDLLFSPAFADAEIALYDIDENRTEESRMMLENIKRKYNKKQLIAPYNNRRNALKNSDYVICAVQVGGFMPCGIRDLEIPAKYGLKLTVGDTLGVSGLFRALRTVPVLLDIQKEMSEVCPNAWFINYVNPMAIVTGALLKAGPIKTIGICHSVQECVPELFGALGMDDAGVLYEIAGINHMGWLLKVSRGGQDLYPEIKKRALAKEGTHDDMVRFEVLKQFGYYVTESSRHFAEYTPYFIKNAYPGLIDRFNIPINAYIINSRRRSERWDKMKQELVQNADIEHQRTAEYASYILESIETNTPYLFNGNVLNTGLIPNLPENAIVEVPCVADGTGIRPCWAGPLPEHLAGLCRTNINMQLMAIEACLSHKLDDVYYAAMLDPHTASELSIDDINALCDELIEAHGDWLLPLKN